MWHPSIESYTVICSKGFPFYNILFLAVGGFNGKSFLNTIEFFDFDTKEWTTSVSIDSNNNQDLDTGLTVIEAKSKNADSSAFLSTNSDQTDFSKSPSKMKNSISHEPLMEVEETVVGH